VADPLEEELKRLIDGVKVGFNSPGDVADPLQEDLKRLIRTTAPSLSVRPGEAATNRT
jgi:hypothetical protein